MMRPLPPLHWPTRDPFLFCAWHRDLYPPGDGHLGPRASLAGRELGMDFTPRDGWRMYHGRRVPGFPRHPHAGFETVTVVRQGLVDHHDSLGATGRLGPGDVQWMTAGRGIEHSEMFPLVHADRPNPLEIFQVWLNLPEASRRAPPGFLVHPRSARRLVEDPEGGRAWWVAGPRSPPPPEASWAARPEAGVEIALIDLPADGGLALPPAPPGVLRTLYVHEGAPVEVGGRRVEQPSVVALDEPGPTGLRSLGRPASMLLLGGRPIGEPVVHHGPFVAGSRDGLLQAFTDWQSGRFGRWPWPVDDPVHPPEAAPFHRGPSVGRDSPMG